MLQVFDKMPMRNVLSHVTRPVRFYNRMELLLISIKEVSIRLTFVLSGELPIYSNQKKIKQRRMAKRVARERLKLTSTENNSQGQSFESRRL